MVGRPWRFLLTRQLGVFGCAALREGEAFMKHDNYVIDDMITAKAIAARVESMAGEISQQFKDTEKLVVIGLLRGSFMFIADLVREFTDG